MDADNRLGEFLRARRELVRPQAEPGSDSARALARLAASIAAPELAAAPAANSR